MTASVATEASTPPHVRPLLSTELADPPPMRATTALAPSPYKEESERTIRLLERAGIATFPSKMGRKGSYVTGWPTMAAVDAIALTRQELAKKRIGLAGRTGNRVAVCDLDAKSGVDPKEMLHVLRRLLGPAIIAIVRTGRGFHIWLQVAESVGNGFCSFIGGEIFSDAHLAMLPPSPHPSGHQYAWELEPREAEAAVDLKALGLEPDKPAASPRDRNEGTAAAAPPEIQQEFAHLMATAGVQRVGDAAQTLTLCPWHADRRPSLSINWDAALFCCFSEQCQARGGIGSLRRRVGADTPSYRQWAHSGNTSSDRGEEDHLSGDKSGCLNFDAATERLAVGLEDLDLDGRAQAVRDCHAFFRVGKCTSCARTPAFAISCSHPLCVRCMPGRLAADWGRHRASLPATVNIVMLRPRNVVAGSRGVLKTVRSRFAEWRKRAGARAGIYGGRLDPECGAAIMLAVPSDMTVAESSRAFDVEVVAMDRTPTEFLGWLQSQYVDEAQSWTTLEDLQFLIDETKGRRRFQGFGAIYAERTESETVERKEGAQMAKEAKSEEGRRPLGRVSGGSFKGKRENLGHACSFCGGVVGLYPFSVPAAEVDRVGNGWLWRGASAGPPEGRRLAR
jgi:Bifunctional DNA primase/polymerase, N-terminal